MLKKYDVIKEEEEPEYVIEDYELVLQYINKNKSRVLIKFNIPNETEEFGSGCGGHVIMKTGDMYSRCTEQIFDTLKFGKFRRRKWRKKRF